MKSMQVLKTNISRPFIQTVVILSLLAVLIVFPQRHGWNEASRMATIQSLVEHHTFVIDKTLFVSTGDKVFINNHFYSDKLPIPSILGALAYFPLYHLGFSFEHQMNLVHYLIMLFTVKAFWFFGLIAFYLTLRQSNALIQSTISERACQCLTLALGMGSLYFTWSSTFNNHILSASQLTIGFYFLMQAKYLTKPTWNLFYAGLFFALAGTADAPTLAFYGGFLCYLFMDPKQRKAIWAYLVPAIVFIGITLSIFYHISGSIMPLQINTSYFHYPNSPWLNENSKEQLSGTTLNQGFFLLTYAFHSLIGQRGFFSYNPFLCLAIPFLILEIWRRRLYHREALVIGVASLTIIIYYLLMTSNYGGCAFGMRWFVPLLPLLFFFMYPFFTNFNKKKRWWFTLILVVSMVISSIGLNNAWAWGCGMPSGLCHGTLTRAGLSSAYAWSRCVWYWKMLGQI
jgi:hypothetical protein